MNRRLFYLVLIGFLATPLAAQTTQRSLAEFNREMQQLYQQVQAQTVRVQIPVPTQQVAQADHPLIKWGPKLDQSLVAKLQSGQPIRVYIRQPEAATTNLTTSGATRPQIQLEDLNADTNLVPITSPTTVECIGIILDDQGHVMMPAWVDPRAAGDRPMRALIGQRRIIGAKFVGSDQQTNTTVVKLDEPVGKAATLGDAKPDLGTMVLMCYPNRSDVRVELWTGGREDYAIVVGMDGRVGGVVQRGHMLSPALLKPVIDELVKTGEVKRAKVGITVREVFADDPARQSILGVRPAVRVIKVLKDFPADAAGVLPGDLILSLAGEPLDDVPSFAAAITAKQGRTELRIMREGAEKNLFLDLKRE